MTIAGHHSMMAPYDAEVEYLESTGTQWIDTGYVPRVPIVERYKLICTVPQWDFSWQGWFGNNASNNVRDVFFRQRMSADNLQAYTPRADANYWAYKQISGLAAGQKVEVRIAPFGNDNNCYFTKADGVGEFLGPVSKHNTASTVTSDTVSLFTNSKSEATTRRMRIYGFSVQIYSTDEYLMDFIPVRRNGVGYMYDRVTRRLFGNQGTGAFIIGPDKH